MIIKILDWEDKQTGELKRVVHPKWFKLYNDMMYDSRVFSLDNEEFRTYIYCLCEASKANKNGSFTLMVEHIRVFNRVSDRVLYRALEKLKQNQLIELRQTDGSWAKSFETHDRIEENRIEENRREESLRGFLASDDALSADTDQSQKSSKLLSLWNEHCGMLPKARGLSKKRNTAIRERFKENSDLEYWKKVIGILAASKFCNGENDRKWKADFDFLIKPDTHLRALEGKYSRHVNAVEHPETRRIREKLRLKALGVNDE